MRTRIVGLIVAVALVASVVAVPRRAQAGGIDPLIYIIPAAIAGFGIVAGVVVATASSDQPHFLHPNPRTVLDRQQPPPRLRFSTQCQPVEGVMPLICW